MKAFFRTWWKFTLMLSILAGIVANHLITSRNEASIASYQVKRQDLTQTLTLTGTVNADQDAILKFQTGGRLAWIGVKAGDTVRAYQGLASLDQRDVENTLKQQLNLYMKTRWDFEQLKEDNASKIIDDRLKRILEKSQFDLNNSVLSVELRALAVEYATLVSPVSGIVTRVDMPVAGVNINASQAIEVVNPESMYVSVLADQTEVGQLQKGMKADVIFDAYPSEHIGGMITSVAFTPKAGETSTVYEAKLILAATNDTYKYRLGMTSDVNFVTSEKKDVLAIPTSFVKEEKDKKYVFKSVGAKKEKITVQVGQESDDLIQIVSGLTQGDVIYDTSR
ncbi:hypothetical protein A2971_00500 [Candidatus Gottesmanbacteria bacterium RIFCSPLOWO2_01_FULL_46_21]|uniref:Uncharacterized protein n=1 Tax=Candidatus Gottesmanbacteria bacterium RIFCSPLOWO2_01_FULL_46_21 TaxID=1798393 RepID=A0A1F6AYV0_9BACT|nr:MAG: hypothetical protein A2971_00500 [Candidatus Gottesmanbacteria bacterium RIFCSPLOWO2_01_FULL_46_21]